jgi:hypothetical protein
LSPTTAAPAAGAVIASAAAAATANADADANAAPLPPRRRHHSRWCQMPSSPRNHLAFIFDAVERSCSQQPMSPAPLNPVFIVHRHHLVLRGTILCHVGNLFCLKLQQI